MIFFFCFRTCQLDCYTSTKFRYGYQEVKIFVGFPILALHQSISGPKTIHLFVPLIRYRGTIHTSVRFGDINLFWTPGYVYVYSCPRRNVPDFVRVFLMLKYNDITQNTYVQSWTVTEIRSREKCGLLAGPRTVPVSWQSYPRPSLSVVSYYSNSAHACSKLLMYFLLGDKVVQVSVWHSCHV